jgi:acyl-CoA thioesterase FadM
VTADSEVARGITIRYRARFDECGADGLVRSSTLLRYAQDLAWIHSERVGFPRDWYVERGLAWVVRAAELAILVPLPLGETITMSTAIIGVRRVWGRRRTEGRLDDGTLALWANTDWVMTDTQRGAPLRVPTEFATAFDVPPGTFEPSRVQLPEAPAAAHRFGSRARPHDLDPMGHVNNAAYLDYLEEALLEAGPDGAALTSALPRRIRLEYVAAATPGAVLEATTWPIDGGCAWRLAAADGRDIARATVTAE